MDKYLVEKKYVNIPIVLKKYNGDILYKSIIGFKPTPFSKATHALLLKNIKKEEYDKSPNDDLLTPVLYDDIESISYQIDIT